MERLCRLYSLTIGIARLRRRSIVDEAALLQVLQQHRILGAALDVYDAEPLAADPPLRKADNALLLAHCGWPTDEGYSRIVPETVRVIEPFLDGAPINVENPSAAVAR